MNSKLQFWPLLLYYRTSVLSHSPVQINSKQPTESRKQKI